MFRFSPGRCCCLGEGVPCNPRCSDDPPLQLQVDVSGVTGGVSSPCSNCDPFNGTFFADLGVYSPDMEGQCMWRYYYDPAIDCFCTGARAGYQPYAFDVWFNDGRISFTILLRNPTSGIIAYPEFPMIRWENDQDHDCTTWSGIDLTQIDTPIVNVCFCSFAAATVTVSAVAP